MRSTSRLGKLWLTEVDLGDFAVRSVLIRGEERVAVWDTLSHPDDMLDFLPVLKGWDVVAVYSHADWDHVWGTAGLPPDNTLIVGHDLCRERFSLELPSALAEKVAENPAAWQAVELIPPTVTFTRNHIVDLGSVTLHLHHLPGHTADSIVGFLPDEGVLLAGDTVETPLPQVPPDCDLARWIEDLRRWQEDPRVRTVIPSHGAIGGRELLAKNIAYLEQLRDGEEAKWPEPLNDFYLATHLANIRGRRWR